VIDREPFTVVIQRAIVPLTVLTFLT